MHVRLTTFTKIKGGIAGSLLAITGMFGSPTFAQENQCGTHSVDALFQEALGAPRVQLVDGTVFGTPIADATADFGLFTVGNELGLIISGGGLIGSLEFALDKVAAADAKDFEGAGFGISLADIGTYSGCSDVSDFPQYVGTGRMLSADGQSVPATARLFMWLGTDPQDDSSVRRIKLFAVGVIRSQVINGRFYIL